MHELKLIADTTMVVGDVLEEGDEGELGWQERALCAQTDPEAFFPEKGGSTREAKKVCIGCDVRGECLEYALEHEDESRFGIWGGTSERERRSEGQHVPCAWPLPAPAPRLVRRPPSCWSASR